MANTEIVKLQFKRGPEAQLPTLDAGEPAITTDTNKLFVGDGATNHQVALQADLNTVNNSIADLYNNKLPLKANATDLANKADKTYVDSKTAVAGNAAPKGVYTTLANLQSAHPTGDTNVYLVTGNVKEVDTLNITGAPTTSGNITVTLNGTATNVAVTAGTKEVDTLTVTGAPTAPGTSNVTVTLNGIANTIAVNGGTKEVDTLTVGNGATTAGNITVTLNGVGTTIAVAASDSASAVATKIAAGTFTGWTASASSNIVTFTKSTVGTNTAPSFTDTGTTGVTATSFTATTPGVVADTTSGVATKIAAATYANWTASASSATVTFTAKAVGTNTAPSFSGGTTGATATTSVTTAGVAADTTTTVATKVRGTTFAGWTTAGSGTVVTFTKSTAGTNVAPVFTDTGTTGVTATLTATTPGVAADGNWYYWNGSAWAAGGVYQAVNIQSGSITPDKTSFFVPGKNLFNSAIATKDYYINYATGALTALAGYHASDYIAVQPNTQYTCVSATNLRFAFYDVNKTFISGNNANLPTVTTPANTAYMRYSFSDDGLTNQQLEAGSTSTSYEPYFGMALDASQIKPLSVTADKIPDGSITPQKTSFFVTGKNLVNPATLTSGYYVGATTGLLVANPGYYSTDFIPVTPGAQYTCTLAVNMRWAFYSSSKSYISGNNANVQTVTVPNTAAYLRFSVSAEVSSAIQLESGAVQTAYEPYFGMALDGSLLKPGSITVDKTTGISYDPSEIVVDMSPDHLKFYIKGGNALSNKYLKYEFTHNVVPFDPTGTIAQSNMDEWRLNEVYQVTRTGQFSFANDYSESVVNTGEWECALHEKDASDFMGGWNHGDEIQLFSHVQFDGVGRDFNTTAKFTCKNIKFVQKSQLYRVFTQTPVATHLKVYEVTAEQGIHLYQEVQWLTALTIISSSYLTMFPIKRTLYGDGTQITDTFYRDSDYQITDVSTPTAVAQNAMAGLSGIKHADIWGSTSGISGRVTILQKPSLPGENMFVTNSTSYNKFYWSIVGSDYNTAVNEKWVMETIFKLDVTL